MERFYTESIWNSRRGLNVVKVFERGCPVHFAIFYDEKRARNYVDVLNKEKTIASFRPAGLEPLEEE